MIPLMISNKSYWNYKSGFFVKGRYLMLNYSLPKVGLFSFVEKEQNYPRTKKSSFEEFGTSVRKICKSELAMPSLMYF